MIQNPIKNIDDVKTRVQTALEHIKPALHADGGDAEIVEITADGVVKLELKGACGGCAMSMMTLKNGIERVIKAEVPEISSVETFREQ